MCFISPAILRSATFNFYIISSVKNKKKASKINYVIILTLLNALSKFRFVHSGIFRCVRHRQRRAEAKETACIHRFLAGKLCKWYALLPFNTGLLIRALRSLATFYGGVLTSDVLDTCTSYQTWWKTCNLLPH